MVSLLKEKFGLDRFERKKTAFFKKHGWHFMPFAQKDPLPDPRLLVPHQVGEIRKLIDAIKEGDLTSFIVSDVGMGKTALCKFLAEVLPLEERPRVVTVYLPGSVIETPEHMLRLILSRLELEPKGDLAAEFEQIYRWHEMYPDLLLVVIIDEFPDICEGALEVVRAIADIRGITWILNGQKRRLLTFVGKHSPALLQRKRLLVEMKPMGVEEAEELLSLRIAWARGDFNGRTIEPFTRAAIAEIQRRSRGIPREMLKLAGDAVYLAIESGESKITPVLVRRLGKLRRRKRKAKPGFLSLVRRRLRFG